jgi:hypothetical protein
MAIGVHGINAMNVYHKYGPLPQHVYNQLVANIRNRFPAVVLPGLIGHIANVADAA